MEPHPKAVGATSSEGFLVADALAGIGLYDVVISCVLIRN